MNAHATGTDQSRTKSAYALQWNRFRIVRPEEDRATFRGRTGLAPGDLSGRRVLDAGCGMGRYLRVAAEGGPGLLVGLDLSGADESGFEATTRSGFGGESYGGSVYGGDPYGGSTYANWAIPQWSYNAPNRMPSYGVIAGLSGTVEGTVTWAGAPPPKVTTACGPIDNPTLRLGTDRAVRGALVYIEKVVVGRPTPYFSRPAAIGGVVAKHGCVLAPAA